MKDDEGGRGTLGQQPGDGIATADRTGPRRNVLLAAGLLVALMIGLACVSRPVSDTDVGWHLAVGRWVVDHKAVPHTDVFSCTIQGKPWVSHEWLAEVALYGVERAGGMAAVRALNVALFAVFAAALGWLVWRRFPRGVALPLLIFCYGLHLAEVRFNWRPEILSIPILVVLTGRLLLRAPGDPPSWRECAAWWVVTALWANMHGMVYLGVGLVGVYVVTAWGLFLLRSRLGEAAAALADGAAMRRWTALFLGMLGAAFLVPEGWAMLGHAWDIFARSGSAKYPVREWTPGITVLAAWAVHVLDVLSLSAAPRPEDLFQILFIVVSLSVAAFICMALARRRFADLPRLALAAACVVLALYAVRLVWLTALSALCVGVTWEAWVAHRADPAPAPNSGGRRIAKAALCLLLVAVLGAWAVGTPERRGIATGHVDSAAYPVGMARFLNAARYEGNLYNPYRWGGYFLFALNGRAKVFIDGRNDAYMRAAPEVFEEYHQVQTAQPAAPDVLRKYNVDLIVLPWPQGALFPVRIREAAARYGRFLPALMNEEGMLFVRADSPACRAIARFWSERGVRFTDEQGADMAGLLDHRELAVELGVLRADHWRAAQIADDPAQPAALRSEAAAIAGNDLLPLGLADQAGRLFDLALGLDKPNIDAMFGLARVAWLKGREDEARRRVEEILGLVPDDHVARMMSDYLAPKGPTPSDARKGPPASK